MAIAQHYARRHGLEPCASMCSLSKVPSQGSVTGNLQKCVFGVKSVSFFFFFWCLVVPFSLVVNHLQDTTRCVPLFVSLSLSWLSNSRRLCNSRYDVVSKKHKPHVSAASPTVSLRTVVHHRTKPSASDSTTGVTAICLSTAFVVAHSFHFQGRSAILQPLRPQFCKIYFF